MTDRWSLMQDMEAMRHLAELLEARGPNVSPAQRQIYVEIVAQLRAAADTVYEIWRAESA
jgi:hypothetical protein